MLSCMGIRKLRESNDIDIVLKRDYYKKVLGAHEDDYFLTEHLKDKLNSNNIKVQKHIERDNEEKNVPKNKANKSWWHFW